MSRHTIWKDDRVHVEAELLPTGEVFLHCTIDKWNKTVYLFLLDLFSMFLLELKNKNINKVYSLSRNSKLDKFCEMLGMKLFEEHEEYSLYVREVE